MMLIKNGVTFKQFWENFFRSRTKSTFRAAKLVIS